MALGLGLSKDHAVLMAQQAVLGDYENLMVGRWFDDTQTMFDAAGTEVIDVTGNGLNLNLVQSSCASLNGTNQYGSGTNAAVQLQEFTITGWFKVNSAFTGNDFVLGSGNYSSDGYNLRLNALDGALRFWIPEHTGANDIVSTIDCSDDAWHSFTASVAGGVASLSVDSETPVTASGIGTITYGHTGLALGSRDYVSSSPGEYFTGDLAGIIFKNGSNTIVADYGMSHAAGSILYDASGSGNDLTIQNAGSNWGSTQAVFHGNTVRGTTRYTHATSDPIDLMAQEDETFNTITPPAGYSKDADYNKGFNPATSIQAPDDPAIDDPQEFWRDSGGNMLVKSFSDMVQDVGTAGETMSDVSGANVVNVCLFDPAITGATKTAVAALLNHS